MYTLLPLLCTALALAFQQVRAGRRAAWLAYFLAATACGYTHYWGLFAVLAINVLYWLAPCRRPAAAPWLALQALVAAAWLPWLPVLRSQFVYSHGYLPPPWIFAIPITFIGFSLGRFDRTWLKPDILVYTPFELLVIAAALAALLAGAFHVKWTSANVKLTFPRRLRHLAPIGMLILPLLLIFLVSLQLPLYTHLRYPIMVFPFFCIVLARGLLQMKPVPRAVIAGLLLLSWGLQLQSYFTTYVKTLDRKMINAIEQEARPGDVILTINWATVAYAYYGSGRLVQVGFPRPDYKGAIYEGGGSGYDVPALTRATVARVRSLLRGRRGALWVLRGYDTSMPPREAPLLAELARIFKLEQQDFYMEGQVLRFAPLAP